MDPIKGPYWVQCKGPMIIRIYICTFVVYFLLDYFKHDVSDGSWYSENIRVIIENSHVCIKLVLVWSENPLFP